MSGKPYCIHPFYFLGMFDLADLDVWVGRVDRLSGSGNAMVKSHQTEPFHGVSTDLNGQTNLGPLPSDVVGEQVLFFYEGGTYGLCLDEEWISEEYLARMSSKAGFPAGKWKTRAAIIDASSPDGVSEGEIYTAIPWAGEQWSKPGDKYPSVVKLKPEDIGSNDERVYLGVVKGSVPPGEFPFTVQAMETRGVKVLVEARTIELASGVPKVGEVCVVRTKEASEEGTVSVYEADRPVRVLIRDVEYPLDGSLNVRITEQHASHLIAEPELRDIDQPETISASDIDLDSPDTTSRIIISGEPIDIRPLPAGVPRPEEIIVFDKIQEALVGAWNVQAVSGGHGEISAGERIDLDVSSVNENRIFGFREDFPIVCHVDVDPPTELQGVSLRVTIRSIAPDRATATLTASSFEEGDVVSVTPIGSRGGDMFSVTNGHLIRVSSSEQVPLEETFRAGIESSGTIPRASVRFLPEFQSEKDHTTQIRLPSTTGKVVFIDGIPVKTSDLLNLTTSVTLGIDTVNADHLVPSLTALPDSQVPDVGDCLLATVEEPTDNVIISAVGERLPIELLKPPSTKIDQTYVRVIEHESDKLRAVVTTTTDDKSIKGFSEQFELTARLISMGEYSLARSILAVARVQLPSDYPTISAIVDARYALLSSTELLSKNADSSTIEILHKACDKLSNRGDIDASGNLSRLLDAYELEVKAAIACADAYENVNRGNKNPLQAIARGVEAKQPVEEAIEKLQQASRQMKATEFESSSPSPEILHFLRRFEEGFSYPIPQLSSWRMKHEARTTRNDSLNTILPVSTESIVNEPSYFEVTATDRAPEHVWERPALTDETIQHTAIGEEPQVAPELIQNTSSDADNGQTSGDAAIETTADTTLDPTLHPDEPSASPEKTTTDVALEESSQAAADEQETSAYTPASGEVASADSSIVGESSGSVPSSDVEQSDSAQATIVDEIPEVTSELRQLREQAEEDATENPIKQKNTASRESQYQRSSKVREYALTRANGQCEACNSIAPFKKPSGDPFLEVHHVDEIGQGGADSPALVVAICPNCHREIHYGKDGNQLNKELRAKLNKGLGDVGAA